MTMPLVAQDEKSVSGSKGPAHDYDYNDHSQRENEKAKTGDSGDYNDRSRYYYGMSSYV